MFRYDTTGICDNGGTYTPAPEGVYKLQIVDASDTNKDGNHRINKNGDPYVNVRCEIAEGDERGKTIWHNVTFFKDKEKKGAGISKHFLKTIGQQWEGKIEVEPDQWVGRLFQAKVIIEKDDKGNPRNAIKYILDDNLESDKQSSSISASEEDVPF